LIWRSSGGPPSADDSIVFPFDTSAATPLDQQGRMQHDMQQYLINNLFILDDEREEIQGFR
jgi:hypothetical protein